MDIIKKSTMLHLHHTPVHKGSFDSYDHLNGDHTYLLVHPNSHQGNHEPVPQTADHCFPSEEGNVYNGSVHVPL